MNKPERFLLASMEFAGLWKQRQELLRSAPPQCECTESADFGGGTSTQPCFSGKHDLEASPTYLCDAGKRRREIYLELIGLAKAIAAARRKMLRAYR